MSIVTGAQRESVELAPGATAAETVGVGGGLPYRPLTFPTNYLYAISITSESGFVPFLEIPESKDSRLLGVRIRLVPTYDRR